MAKKRASKPEPAKDQRSGKPVRLDLAVEDFERLERCARRKGLTKSAFSRMAVLELIRSVEAEG